MDFPLYHDRAHDPYRYYRYERDYRPDPRGYGAWGAPRPWTRGGYDRDTAGRGRAADPGRARAYGAYRRGFDIGPTLGGPDVGMSVFRDRPRRGGYWRGW